MIDENEMTLFDIDEKEAKAFITIEPHVMHELPNGSKTYQFEKFRIYEHVIPKPKKKIYLKHFVPKDE